MANARMIRRNFFNDPLIAERYDDSQRYLLIGVACASDDYGRFWWNGKSLKSIIYPLDNRQPKWIEKNLELFLKDEILCKYEVKNIIYGHFPLWFDKSFCLKQRLDHPKPEQSPDCKIHQMNEKNTRTSRETSPPSKVNITELNTNKESVGTDTLSISLIEEMKSKYADKDVDAIADKVIAYYQGKSVPLDLKFKQWCEGERVESNGAAAAEFKLDSTGHGIVGYCSKCGESEFYPTYGDPSKFDSKCKKGCKAKVLPSRNT